MLFLCGTHVFCWSFLTCFFLPTKKATGRLHHAEKVGGRFTPLKTNMSPKNQWLEGVFPIEIVPF